VIWRCRDCGAHYPLAEYRDRLDDILEAELADTRCDRL
jgi:ribosomal protein L37AE/L43A